jgi:hypothetical protein
MIANLALGALLMTTTVSVHFAGLLLLLWLLRSHSHRLRPRESPAGQGVVILVVVLGLVVAHAAEIWCYALAYMAVSALPDFETALYFSTASFTTMGYGDVVLDKNWRLFGAIEGTNGLLLFGWSTAFLFSATSRLSALEHNWLDRQRPR